MGREETYMVCSYGVDLLDAVTECHRLVDKKLDEVVGGRLPGQQFKLAVYGARPRDNNPGGDLRRQSE